MYIKLVILPCLADVETSEVFLGIQASNDSTSYLRLERDIFDQRLARNRLLFRRSQYLQVRILPK